MMKSLLLFFSIWLIAFASVGEARMNFHDLHTYAESLSLEDLVSSIRRMDRSFDREKTTELGQIYSLIMHHPLAFAREKAVAQQGLEAIMQDLILIFINLSQGFEPPPTSLLSDFEKRSLILGGRRGLLNDELRPLDLRGNINRIKRQAPLTLAEFGRRMPDKLSKRILSLQRDYQKEAMTEMAQIQLGFFRQLVRDGFSSGRSYHYYHDVLARYEGLRQDLRQACEAVYRL